MHWKRTWNDSFIIDSHVIIVLRHPLCTVLALIPFASVLFIQRHWQTHARQAQAHNTHIIYEHMFCSCWSFAITLTTWSVAITRRCHQQMTWYKQCSLTYDTKAIRLLRFDIYLGDRFISVDWKRWEFAYRWQIQKFIFATLFLPFREFLYIAVWVFNF